MEDFEKNKMKNDKIKEIINEINVYNKQINDIIEEEYEIIKELSNLHNSANENINFIKNIISDI